MSSRHQSNLANVIWGCSLAMLTRLSTFKVLTTWTSSLASSMSALLQSIKIGFPLTLSSCNIVSKTCKITKTFAFGHYKQKLWLNGFCIRGRTQITLAVEGGGGFVKCVYYYISLCSKLANKGGRGVKNLQKSANLCTAP